MKSQNVTARSFPHRGGACMFAFMRLSWLLTLVTIFGILSQVCDARAQRPIVDALLTRIGELSRLVWSHAAGDGAALSLR
jgi:hypothetical protein